MGPLFTWMCYPSNWHLTSLSDCLSYPMLCWRCSLYISQEFKANIWAQCNFNMKLWGVSSGQYPWPYALMSICHHVFIVHQWNDRRQCYGTIFVLNNCLKLVKVAGTPKYFPRFIYWYSSSQTIWPTMYYSFCQNNCSFPHSTVGR